MELEILKSESGDVPGDGGAVTNSGAGSAPTSPSILKHCPGCGVEKPRAGFYKNRARKDGITSYCKSCFNVSVKYYQQSPERKAVMARYRQSLEGKTSRKAAEVKRGQSPKRKAYQARYQKESPKYKAYRVRYQKESPKYKMSHLRYRQSDKGKATKRRVEYKRRARETKAGIGIATLTAAQWRETLNYYNYACVYCGKSNIKLEQDHAIPISKGGKHTKDNVIPACRSCNSSKHTKKWKPLPILTLREIS